MSYTTASVKDLRGPHRLAWIAALLALLAMAFAALAAPGRANAQLTTMSFPVPVISASTTYVQVGTSATLDGSQSYGIEMSVIQSWEWNFGDGTTASGPVQQHTFTTQGQTAVVLTVTDQYGTSRSATQYVAVWGYPTASLAATPTTGRGPLTVNFDASASTAPGWGVRSTAWNFGDGTTGTGFTASHTYATPGQYMTSFTITNNLGFAATAYQTINVTEIMAPPTALTATSPTRGNVTLKWANHMSTIFSTEIQRCSGSSCTAFATVNYVTATATSYSEGALRSGTTFRYRIKVTDYAGNAGYSKIVSIKVR